MPKFLYQDLRKGYVTPAPIPVDLDFLCQAFERKVVWVDQPFEGNVPPPCEKEMYEDFIIVRTSDESGLRATR